MRDEEQSSPYSSSNAQGDSSSRAIASAPTHAPDHSSTRTSSNAPGTSQPSRSRNVALGEQFNSPLRPHVWTSKKQWTRPELERERQDFFDTRVTGRPEIWGSLRAVVGLLAEGEIATAQGILDAAAITLTTGDLLQGAYDEVGNFYQMPEHIISDPTNVAVPAQNDAARGGDNAEETEDDETERRREEKGKAVLKSEDIIKVRARLSDRGGPDIVISLGKDQTVRVLIRRIQEEANVSILDGRTPLSYCAKFSIQVPGKGRIKIAYLGRILKEGDTLQSQGWRDGHVINALIF